MKKFIILSAKLWPLLVLGLIIRLVLMPITLHPDIWAVSFAQNIFAFKGIINIYDYLGNLPVDSVLAVNYGRNFFTYPPLAYFTLGFFGLLLKPLFNADFFINLAANLPNILDDGRLFWHLFLTKLPYLFFDFGILFLLNDYFQEEKKKKLAVMLWIFNPVVLYTSYMIGQFDIIPVFFTVLSLYLAKRKKIYWSVFYLGIGGAFKMYPLFFLPFLAFSEGKKIKDIFKILLVGALPYFLSILPFLGSVNFRQTVLLSNQSQKMLFAKMPVSGAEYLSVFVVLYIFLAGISFLKKIELWKWFLAVLLLFFSVTHYHPQWFLWLSPFLVFFWVDYPRFRIFPVSLFFCWFLILLLFEPSLSVSLFAPISYSLNEVMPLSDFLSRYYDVFQLKSIIRSIFAGVSLFIFWINLDE